MPEPVRRGGGGTVPAGEPEVRIEVADLVTGETETTEVASDGYVVICGRRRMIAHVNAFPKTGTVQVTIKRVEGEHG